MLARVEFQIFSSKCHILEKVRKVVNFCCIHSSRENGLFEDRLTLPSVDRVLLRLVNAPFGKANFKKCLISRIFGVFSSGFLHRTTVMFLWNCFRMFWHF